MTQGPFLDFNIPLGPSPTPRELKEARDAAAPGSPTLDEVFNEVTLTGSIIEFISRPDFAPNPEFRPSPELIAERTRGLPPDIMEEIVQESNSLDEFQYRIRNARERLKVREKIASLGYGGAALQFGVSMMDPVFLAAAPVAGIAFAPKVAGSAFFATRASLRANAALRGLGMSAAVDVPLELVRQGVDPLVDGQDFVLNTLGSIALGTGISGAFPRMAGFQKGWKTQIHLENVRLRAETAQKMAQKVGNTPGDTTMDVNGTTFTIVPPRRQEIIKEVNGLGNKVYAEARKLGISTQERKIRTADQEAFNITANMPNDELLDEARRLGVPTELSQGRVVSADSPVLPRFREQRKLADIRKDVVKARQAELEKGQLRSINEVRNDVVEARIGAEVRSLGKNRKQLFKEAAKYGVPTHNDPGAAGKRTFRKTEDITEELIDVKYYEGSLDRQGQRAAVKALKDTPSEVTEVLDLIEFDYAKEATKPLPEESIWSRALNILPFAKPMAIMFRRSTNPQIQKMGAGAVEMPTGDNPNVDVGTTVQLNVDKSLTLYHKRRLAVEKQLGPKRADEFDNVVLQNIREGIDMDGVEGEAQEAIRQIYAELAQYADRRGLSGISQSIRRNYVTREGDPDKVVFAVEKFGREEVLRLLRGAFRANNPNASEAKVSATAEAWLKYAHDPKEYVNARVAPGKNSARKIKALEEELKKAGLSKEEIADVVDRIAPKSNDPHLGMTNRRINFDEGYSIEVPGAGTLKFGDLLNNNPDYLLNKYIQRIVGASEFTAYAKGLGVEVSGTGNLPTMNDFLKFMEEGGEVPRWASESFNVFYRHIMGMPQGDISQQARRHLRALQEYTFIQSMVNVGIAQMPELMNSTVSNGLTATLQQVPALLKLKRRALDGEIDSPLLASLEAGAAAPELIHQPHINNHRMHSTMSVDEAGEKKSTLGRIRQTVTGFVSGAPQVRIGDTKYTVNPAGIALIDELLRQIHSATTMQDWVNKAYKVTNGQAIKNTFWSKSLDRFKYLGFEGEQLDKLMKELSRPEVIEIEAGGTVAKWNRGAMDPELRAKLDFALRRDVDRVIQRNKIGNMSPWMEHPLSGPLLQFRRFAINATNKQLVYNLQMNDGKAYATFLSTIFVGYLGYIVNTEISARKFSGKERDDFRKKAYGDKDFAGITIPNPMIAGVMRSGAFGSLAPIVGSAGSLIDPEEDDISNLYRTSGYSNNVLSVQSTPVGSLMVGAHNAVREIVPALLSGATGGRLGNKLTEPEVRSIARLFPLRNHILFNKALNELIEAADLPERQR